MNRLLWFFLLVPLMSFSQYTESDWEERDTWMPLDSIYSAVAISKGLAVADIGCHEGYLTLHLSDKIGQSGKVYAVDVRNDRLETLSRILKRKQVSNVDVILGGYSNPKLPKNTLDIVVIMDTYHEMDDYKIILKHVYKALKPGGRIAIFEKLKARVIGKSRDDMTMAHSLAPNYVMGELKQAGFKFKYLNNDLGDWENDPDKTMWLLVAEKPLGIN